MRMMECFGEIVKHLRPIPEASGRGVHLPDVEA